MAEKKSFNPEQYKTINDIAIVDDDASIRDVLEMYAESLGIFRNVIMASDGGLGSKKLRNQKFLLIFLDISMPKKNGIEVIKEFVSDEEHINSVENIIIVSGTLDKAVLNYALSVGVKHFLVKPFTQKQFAEKVVLALKPIRPDLVKKAIENLM